MTNYLIGRTSEIYDNLGKSRNDTSLVSNDVANKTKALIKVVSNSDTNFLTSCLKKEEEMRG